MYGNVIDFLVVKKTFEISACIFKKNGQRSYCYYNMTTPSLRGTPVNNVNFLNVNLVTTLVFFSLSLNRIRCFFFYRK